MEVKKKKKKVVTTSSKTKMSTREKMIQRKKELASKGNGGGILFPKEGTMRVRLMSQGPEDELGIEIIQFYLGQKIGGIISPATFDEPCPFMEKYQELKSSSDEDDQELATKLSPKRRYIVAGTVYKDEKGKEVDTEKVCKPILIPRSVYQDIIDLYLDEDDWGDMTDKEDGYDIKITRSGKGLNDTSYTVTACPGHKPLADKFYKDSVDLSEIIRSQMKSYDELEKILKDYLNETEDEDDDTPVKKVSKKKSIKKKKYKGDI